MVCQKRKRNGKPNIGRKNIQSGHRNGIWNRKMCHANNAMREATLDERNETTKSEKIKALGEKKTYKC